METQDSALRPLVRGAACLLLIVPFFFQLATVSTRGIDPDELEHLHAAFCVWRGMVPYRDFFEHHSPGLYYMLQPAFWVSGPELNVLWLGRTAMCLISLATVAVTWRLANYFKGEIAAWTACLLLSWSSVFVLKGSELRPDVPACLCLVLMAYFTVTAFESPRFSEWLKIGLLGGLATLCTQKSIVPIISLAVSLVVARMLDRPRNLSTDQPLQDITDRPRQPSTLLVAWTPFLGIATGGVVVWSLLAVIFASLGALPELFVGTVLHLIRLPIQSARWEHLRPAISADFTVWLAGVTYLFITGREVVRRQGRSISILLAGSLTGNLLSLGWVRAVYPQYVLLWLPWLTVAAALCLMHLRERAYGGVFKTIAILGLGILICGLECKLLLVGLRNSQSTALLNLRNLGNVWRMDPASVLMVPIGLVALSVYLVRTAPKSGWYVLPLAILGMNYAITRNANTWLWPNRSQVALIKRVNSLANLDDTVLDGFAGYGALRPHASYFWWINRYSLAMMSDADKSTLLRNIQTHPPTVVLYDRELRAWPEIRPLIEVDFGPTPEPPIWVRRKGQGE